MSSFDNYKNKLVGISNVVQSSACDESVHALFGAEIINTIRDENPGWFDDALVEETHEACRVSMEAEEEILDWIFEGGDLNFITKEEVKDYLRWRFNKSMEMIDFPEVFEVQDSTKEKFQWFEMQVNGTTNPDFFARRNVNYTKANKSFDEDDLF
jgi:ribonucleoside-diphosphate reductase beta chain